MGCRRPQVRILLSRPKGFSCLANIRTVSNMPTCGSCKLEKHADEFNIRNKETQKRHTTCRGCQKQFKADHYARNKATYKARAKESKKALILRNKLYVLEYLKQHPCVDCRESDVVVLEFDHVEKGKVESISQMVLDACSIEKIAREIAKCVVRCANCHRRKTAKERGWNAQSLAENAAVPTVYW